jgi:hypothetical protein
MDRVDDTHKQIGDADEEKILIFKDPPDIPGNHEQSGSNTDAEKLS